MPEKEYVTGLLDNDTGLRDGYSIFLQIPPIALIFQISQESAISAGEMFLIFVTMTNNDIMKKLRVALKLRDTDIIEILALVNFTATKTELSAIFRSDDHPNYMECQDQLLRNFLNGLIIYKRGPNPNGAVEEKEG